MHNASNLFPPLSHYTHKNTHTSFKQNFQACILTVHDPCPKKVLLINIIIVVVCH